MLDSMSSFTYWGTSSPSSTYSFSCSGVRQAEGTCAHGVHMHVTQSNIDQHNRFQVTSP